MIIVTEAHRVIAGEIYHNTGMDVPRATDSDAVLAAMAEDAVEYTAGYLETDALDWKPLADPGERPAIISALTSLLISERDEAAEEIPEHAFKPGDGGDSYVDVCQICQHHLSEHEEGEPCCIAFVTSRGNDHTPDCKEA